MSNQNATTAIFIDKYHPKANGLCAISIRITYDRKKKYYPTPISLTPIEFEKTQGIKAREPYKSIALQLQAFEMRAVSVISKLPFFTWQSFEKNYFTNRTAHDTISAAFLEYARQLRTEARIGTASSYECAERSLSKFAKGVRFVEVTPEFLHKYEKWMLVNGSKITTVGFYLRALRTLFNNAIAEGILSKENYPFGKKKYEIPTANNVKKALSQDDIKAIYHYPAERNTTTEMARDFWIFMYLCNGINVKDLCLLKYENLDLTEGVLVFERAKTARTKRRIEPIRVMLNKDLIRIIKKWGNEKKEKTTFVFPVLHKGITPVRERQLIQQFTSVINDHMKKVAQDLNISKTVTTYAARHSFATILVRNNVSAEFISQALGHSNVKTTQSYLGGFEDESKKETVKVLTAFIN